MRPRVFLWVLILFSVICCRAQTNPVHHRFRFFLQPELAAPFTVEELGSRLALYVQDLNTVFSKSTIRRFDFNPASDVTVTNELDSIHGYYPGSLPEEGGYELWAIVKHTTFFRSHGGNMSFATNGAGVAAGLNWPTIHDRNALKNAPAGDEQLYDYWYQVLVIAHELAHVFGAGVGEYYSLSSMQDTTGISPLQDIQFRHWEPETDPYWSQHPDYWTDPLLYYASEATYDETLRGVRFSRVSSAMINAGFRNPYPFIRYIPDLSTTRVWLFSNGPDNPVVNATVRVWLVSQRTDIAQEIFSGTTDAGGTVQFGWPGEPNNDANTILIKAYPPAGEPCARWYSFYEAQEQKVLFGREQLNIYMNLAGTNVAPATTISSDAGGGVRVEWPLRAIDYVLEGTRELKSANWQFINRVAETNGPFYSVKLPTNDENCFFRLRKP